MMERARWAAEEVFGDDWRQSFEKAFRHKAEIMKLFVELIRKGRGGNRSIAGRGRANSAIPRQSLTPGMYVQHSV